MGDNPRLDHLRRRVRADPASIAFAQLAEELRRDGRIDESIAVARDGLTRLPDHHSARVTLARALAESGRPAEAIDQLQRVLADDSGHVAAVRALAGLRPSATGSASGCDSGRAGATIPPATASPLAAAPDAAADPVLAELERWLAAISADRLARR